MNKNIWKIVELVIYILKIIHDYDKRREESQPAEHSEE